MRSYRICLVAIAILITCSLPIFAKKLILYLEGGYPIVQPMTVQKADAIVVLSGMLRRVKTDEGFRYEFSEASDRLFAGIKLLEEKKSSILVLTGGKLPWTVGVSEGEHLRYLAIKMGVSANNIILTETSQNTDQEAKSVKKIVSGLDNRVILVTSAFHMPRAKKVFEAVGLKVIPFPVDFLSSTDKVTIMDFIPSGHAFYRTSFFVREMIGRVYYNLKYLERN